MMSRSKNGIPSGILAGWILCGLLVCALGLAAFEQRLNGVTPHAYGTVGLWSAGLLLAAALLLRVFLAGSSKKKRCCFLGGLMLIAGLPALYALNASHEWRAGVGLFPLTHWHLLPASAFPEGTIRGLWLSVALASSLGAAASLPSGARRLLTALIVSAAAGMALLALHQRMVPRPYPVYEWTGLFVSQNHFAAFSYLVFPVALASGARAQYRAFQGGRLSNPSGFCYLVAGLLAGAVIVTGSRAGIAVMVVQVIGFILIQWRIRWRYPFAMQPFSRIHRMILGSLLVLVLASGGIGLARNLQLVRAVGHDLSFRSTVASDTLAMWRSRQWWGTGPGTFSVVFPYYQTLPVNQYFFKHAHCEPLQFLAEYGILGGGMTLAGFVLIGRSSRRYDRRSTQVPSFMELEGYGLLLALGGVGLHSLVDFPFRHPLILMLTCVWIGLLAGGRSRWKTED